MKTNRILVLAALVIVLVLAACSSGGGQVPATGAGGTSEPGEPGEARVLTLADNGATIQMKTGESLLLKLGADEYRWLADVDDTAVLSRDIAAMIERDAQGLFIANAPGTVLLTAAGTPLCRDAQPACAAPDELFRVTVEVE